MTEFPTGTVTFLFTDIEGSTRLERRLRDRYGGALAEHRRLLREAFSAHVGHEVDTQGDSLFYVFPRALAAVAGAVEAQRALAAHDWPEDGEIRVRIGINTGEASLEDGRYVGFAVHRAARISAAAQRRIPHPELRRLRSRVTPRSSITNSSVMVTRFRLTALKRICSSRSS